MLISWAAIATATVVVLVLVEWAIRLGDTRGMADRDGIGLDPPCTVPAGPVIGASRAEGQGEAVA
jgi:hypothetical protein